MVYLVPGENMGEVLGGVALSVRSAEGQSDAIGGFNLAIPQAGGLDGPSQADGGDAGNALRVRYNEGISNSDAVGILLGAGAGDHSESGVLLNYQYFTGYFGTSDSFVGLEVYDVDDFGLTISDFA